MGDLYDALIKRNNQADQLRALYQNAAAAKDNATSVYTHDSHSQWWIGQTIGISWHYLLAGELDKSEQTLDRLTEKEPDNPHAYINRSHICLLKGEYSQALARYKTHIDSAEPFANDVTFREIIREDFNTMEALDYLPLSQLPQLRKDLGLVTESVQ